MGEGREVIYAHMWLVHFIVQQKSTQSCKAIILQLKKRNPYEVTTQRHRPTKRLRPNPPLPQFTPPQQDHLKIYLVQILFKTSS